MLLRARGLRPLPVASGGGGLEDVALPEALNILALEDRDFDAEMLKRHLQRGLDGDFSFTHCRTPDEALMRLETESFDLLFLDYQLAGRHTGIDFLRFLRARNHQLTTIMLTGRGNEYCAMDATRAGADGYLIKSDLQAESIRRVIAYATEQKDQRLRLLAFERDQEKASRLTHELADLSVQLAQMSRLDSLTRVLHREAMLECVEMVHGRAKRCHLNYCLAVVNLDLFHKFNDDHGCLAGEECLVRVAQILAKATRADDFVGRYGDDEFLIALPETDDTEATHICEDIRQKVHELNIAYENSPVADHVTVSIGMAVGDAGDWRASVDHARQAVKVAKDAGRNQLVVHDPITTSS